MKFLVEYHFQVSAIFDEKSLKEVTSTVMVKIPVIPSPPPVTSAKVVSNLNCSVIIPNHYKNSSVTYQVSVQTFVNLQCIRKVCKVLMGRFHRNSITFLKYLIYRPEYNFIKWEFVCTSIPIYKNQILPQLQFLFKTVLTYLFNRLWANKTKYSIISKNQKLLIV